MPYLNIKTNCDLTEIEVSAVMKGASRICAEGLGKSEAYMLVALDPCPQMFFGGHEEPFAFVELRSIALAGDETTALSALLCQFLGEKLGLAHDRIYLNFSSVERSHWGWNGQTFG